MANQTEAVQAIGQTLDREFNTLTSLMKDISDGTVNGDQGNTQGSGSNKHYVIGGQTIAATGGEASNPGMMLTISNATSLQSVYTGQLADTASKASRLQQQIARSTSGS